MATKSLAKWGGVFSCALVMLLASCASDSWKPTVIPPEEEMEIRNFTALEGRMQVTSYSLAEMAKWNVLVLDTGNTTRFIKTMRQGAESAIKKYHNRGVGEDANPDTALAYQAQKMQRWFKSVVYTPEAEKMYDLLVLRDWQADLQGYSGRKTACTITYYFVYKIAIEGTDPYYVYRGKLTGTGYGVVPYPATSLGFQDANRNATDALDELFAQGLDLYHFTDLDGVVPQIFTEAEIALLTEQTAAALGESVDAVAAQETATATQTETKNALTEESTSANTSNAGTTSHAASGDGAENKASDTTNAYVPAGNSMKERLEAIKNAR